MALKHTTHKGRARKKVERSSCACKDQPVAGRKISMFGRDFPMPRSRRLRIAIGVILIICGMLGFLPVLGFWMLPLGIVVLSYEFATIRRLRRRMEIWWAERRGRRRAPRR